MLTKAEKRNLTEEEQAYLIPKKCMHILRPPRNDPTRKEKKKKEVNVRSIFFLPATLADAIESGNRSTKIEVRGTMTLTSTIPSRCCTKDAYTLKIIIRWALRCKAKFQGEPMWPTVGNVEAQIKGENAELADSEISFDKISASPKRAGVSIRVSRRAINQSNLDLYDIVVEKIASAIAMLLNKWLASPTAIASGVEGVFVKDAAAIIPMSKQPFLDEIVGLETAVLNKQCKRYERYVRFGYRDARTA